jgi:hypothetical protein
VFSSLFWFLGFWRWLEDLHENCADLFNYRSKFVSSGTSMHNLWLNNKVITSLPQWPNKYQVREMNTYLSLNGGFNLLVSNINCSLLLWSDINCSVALYTYYSVTFHAYMQYASLCTTTRCLDCPSRMFYTYSKYNDFSPEPLFHGWISRTHGFGNSPRFSISFHKLPLVTTVMI